MTHRDLFQRSASVLTCRFIEPPLWPTAMQPHARLHATPVSRFDAAGGLGLFTIDQADPFQCSTRVRTGGGPVVGCGTMRVELPTAVQSETPEQETPDRPAVRCADGGGPFTIDQADPFQCSMSA